MAEFFRNLRGKIRDARDRSLERRKKRAREDIIDWVVNAGSNNYMGSPSLWLRGQAKAQYDNVFADEMIQLVHEFCGKQARMFEREELEAIIWEGVTQGREDMQRE